MCRIVGVIVSFSTTSASLDEVSPNAHIDRVLSYSHGCVSLMTLHNYNRNKKNYNMILSCYNYGRVTIIYDATVNY